MKYLKKAINILTKIHANFYHDNSHFNNSIDNLMASYTWNIEDYDTFEFSIIKLARKLKELKTDWILDIYIKDKYLNSIVFNCEYEDPILLSKNLHCQIFDILCEHANETGKYVYDINYRLSVDVISFNENRT
jgi:hypothetical protein